MRKTIMWMIAATSLATGSASADIWGAYVTVYNTSGVEIIPRGQLFSIELVNTPSTSGVMASKINLYTTGDNPIVVRITSANYTRVVDFHKALQAIIQSGRMELYVRAKPGAGYYDANLDTNVVSLVQAGY